MCSAHIPTRTGLTSKDELRLLRGFNDQARRQWIKGESLDTDTDDRGAENNDLPLTVEAT